MKKDKSINTEKKDSQSINVVATAITKQILKIHEEEIVPFRIKIIGKDKIHDLDDAPLSIEDADRKRLELATTECSDPLHVNKTLCGREISFCSLWAGVTFNYGYNPEGWEHLGEVLYDLLSENPFEISIYCDSCIVANGIMDTLQDCCYLLSDTEHHRIGKNGTFNDCLEEIKKAMSPDESFPEDVYSKVTEEQHHLYSLCLLERPVANGTIENDTHRNYTVSATFSKDDSGHVEGSLTIQSKSTPFIE